MFRPCEKALTALVVPSSVCGLAPRARRRRTVFITNTYRGVLMNGGPGGPRRSRLGEQGVDPRLDLTRVPIARVDLSFVHQADPAARIDEVEGRPGAIVERVPHGVVVVEDDGVTHVEGLDVGFDQGALALLIELGSVYPDDLHAARRVSFVDRRHPRQRPAAVDSAEGPDVEYDDPAAEARHAEGPGVQPAVRILSGELGRPSVARWRRPGRRAGPQEQRANNGEPQKGRMSHRLTASPSA